MNKASLCVNIPIYPDMSSLLYFTLSGEREEVPEEELVLSVELPASLIVSCQHAAKAAEEAIRAINRGESLRNRRLEVLRRLLVRKQVKDIEKILENTSGETCFAYVTRIPLTNRVTQCNFNAKAISIVLGEEENFKDLGEQALIAAIALSSAGRWIR